MLLLEASECCTEGSRVTGLTSRVVRSRCPYVPARCVITALLCMSHVRAVISVTAAGADTRWLDSAPRADSTVTRRGSRAHSATARPAGRRELSTTATCVDFVMMDVWGDGWGGGKYFVRDASTLEVVASGTLDTGSQGTDQICLADGCYIFRVSAGDYASETTWNFGGYFSGGAPFQPTFVSVTEGHIEAWDGRCPTPAPTATALPTASPVPTPSPTVAAPTSSPTISPVPTTPNPTATPIAVDVWTFTQFKDAISQAVNASEGGANLAVTLLADIVVAERLTIDIELTVSSHVGAILSGGGSMQLFNIENGGKLNGANITFRDGYSPDGNGGAISSTSGSVNLQNCTLTANTVGDGTTAGGAFVKCGGAIWLSGGTFSMRDCTLTANIANHNGGGVFIIAATMFIMNDCTLSDNAGHYGGSIYSSGTRLDGNNCEFRGNQASSWGGAVFIQAGTNTGPSVVNFRSCALSANTAGWFGGAVANDVTDDSSTNWYDCTLGSNSAQYGGAIWTNEAPTTFTRCVFDSNHASTYGGAVRVSSGSVEYTDSLFVNNFAGGDGGAVVGGGSAASFLHCTLMYNSAAGDGGAVSGAGGDKYGNCTMTYNRADGNGGAVFGGGGIQDSLFEANVATQGGAVSVTSDTTIKNCVFNKGEAFQKGAAVYSEDSGIVMAMVSSLIMHHSAATSGSTTTTVFVDGDSSAAFDRVTWYANELGAVGSAGGAGLLLRNCDGLEGTDVEGAMLLGCNDSTVGEVNYCSADDCSNTPTGIGCYCYADGIETDPSEGLCLDSAQIKLLTPRVDLFADKADEIGNGQVIFSNEGEQILEFTARVIDNPDGLQWTILPSAGNLAGCGAGTVALSVNLTLLPSRAAEYVTLFELASNSLDNRTRSETVEVRTLVSAAPSASASLVNLTNTKQLKASLSAIPTPVKFLVFSVDATGISIQDASNVAYTASLTVSATLEGLACTVSYDKTSDAHRGECHLPPLVAGGFGIEVIEDASGSLVGGNTHDFQITDCPSTYILDDEDSTCKCDLGHFDTRLECDMCPNGEIADERGSSNCLECEFPKTSNTNRTACTECEATYYRDNGNCERCPTQVDCAQGSTISDWVLEAGVWRSDESSTNLRECRFGATSCPGITSDKDNCTARGFGDKWPQCGCGYVGPTCAVCAPEYFLDWSGDACVACGASDGHTPSIMLGCMIVVVAAVVFAFVRNAKKRKQMWYTRFKKFQRLGRNKMSTLFFLCQARSRDPYLWSRGSRITVVSCHPPLVRPLR